MKKLIVIFLCIAVVGIGVGVFLQVTKIGSSIEDILPQEPIVYVQLRDVERNMEEIALMPFWRAISNIDYDLLIEKSALTDQQSVFVNLIRKQFSEVLTNPLAKKLFGREVAFAIYLPGGDIDLFSQEIKDLGPKIAEKLLSGLFLVTRIDPDIQFAEFISRFFNQRGANISKGQVEYKGEVIHTITLVDVGMKFGIVRLGDLLVIGVGETAARASVDVSQKSKPALAKSSQFSRIRSTFLDSSGAVGFFDFETFLTLMKSQVGGFIGSGGEGDEDAMTQSQWEDILEKTSGFEAIAFSSQVAPFMRFNGSLLFDPKKLSDEYASIYTCPSQKNETINFVPKEVLGYQWSNCFQLDHYWRQIKKEMTRIEASASKVDEFEEKIGLSIEDDILPTFGDEIGGYVSDIQMGGFFPIPKLLFFVEIKNRSKAEYLLGRLKDHPFAMFRDEKYKGIPIKYLALPLGESLQPGYCFLDDYLLIATSRQLLKDSIDASGNAAISLAANPDFREVNFGLTDKNRSVQFFKVGKIVEKVKGIVGWSNRWMASKERKAQAFQVGSEKPLEEARASIVVKESELKEIRDSIIILEDDIWNLNSKGEDVSVKEAQLSELKNQVEAKQLEIAGEQERSEELEKIIQENEENAPDSALRQIYLDEVAYPILDSLKSIDSFGLRVTSGKNTLEASAFLKIGN